MAFFKTSAAKAAIERDNAFCRKLFAGLGPLATQARAIAYPDDTVAFRNQRDLVDRLNHLAATVGRFPSLIQERETLSALEVLAEQSKNACECLDRVWVILASRAVDMAAFEEAILALEIAIRQRQSV